MASPPFNINESIPADDDIVSQHPANARTFRDVVESWLLVNHNTSGRHDEVDLDVQSSPSGIDSVVRVWANTSGYLKQLFGSGGSEEYVGVPPGTILDYAGSTAPNGYLLCYGQAVSRTTYATLFAAISTTYGVGDGSTTFNLPDLRGRIGAGKDDMGGSAASRLTSGSAAGVDGTTLGDTGGSEEHQLTTDEMPAHDHGGSTTFDIATYSDDPNVGTSTSYGVGTTNPSSTTITGPTIASAGGDSAHTNVQPTIVLNKIIKA